MADLIDRQAAIEVIDAVFPVDPMKSEYAQGIACGAALAKTYVDQLPSVQWWIPVSERLPDEDSWAIWCSKNGVQQIARLKTDAIDHFFPSQGFFGLDDAAAWMPLPEPYEVRDDINK